MKLQVLLSVMNQTDRSIVKKVNISTAAVIVNQASSQSYETFTRKGSKITFITNGQRGVGRSRNLALMNGDADIYLFADQDMEYVNDYPSIVKRAFKQNRDADMILFNVPSKNQDAPTYEVRKKTRVRKYNSLRYGAVQIAIRSKSIDQANVFFSLLFGGGAKYSAGEDSLFIYQCIQRGLRVYALPKTIGYVDQENSTWFKGYTKKFFIDKGVFFACLSPRFARLLVLQYVLRKHKGQRGKLTLLDKLRLANKGITEFQNMRSR